jgi:hypothetical protein
MLIHLNDLRESFGRLRTSLYDKKKGGLQQVMVPEGFKPSDYPYNEKTVTKWNTIFDPVALENVLFCRNTKHFGQGKGTHFTEYPLNQIGPSADTQFAEDILKGEYPPVLQTIMDNDPLLAKFIHQLCDRGEKIDITISRKDVKDGFKCWAELTSTSPSGRHLSLYKCLLAPDPDDPDKDEDGNPITTKSDQLLQMFADMLDISAKHGSPLPRWQFVANAMLEKIPGCPWLHKLRVIHIIKADYNLMLRIILARRLMWHCKDRNWLGDSQLSSRKGRSAKQSIL